ncbi:MAG TPA: hypothetical protein VLM85_23835, partial [Polyangiaceae bacterium]|nr:hypothetical protein [Polyangiaceae bacterium]
MRWILASFALLAACRGSSPPPSARADTPPPAPRDAGSQSHAMAPPDASVVVAARAAPAEVERVAVLKDSPASIVRGPEGVAPHIVFMPGLCSNAYAYLLSFPEAARAHGGVVAIDGDQACGDLKD